jgi:hypothetical protein
MKNEITLNFLKEAVFASFIDCVAQFSRCGLTIEDILVLVENPLESSLDSIGDYLEALVEDDDENDGLDLFDDYEEDDYFSPFSDEEDDEEDDDYYDEEAEDTFSRTSWPNVGNTGFAPLPSEPKTVRGPSWPNTGGTAQPQCQKPTGKFGGTWPNVGGSFASQKANTGGVATVTPPQVAKTIQKKTEPARAVVKRDSRSRACVPVELSKKVGFGKNSQVFVSKRAGGPGLMLLKKPTKSGHLSTYKTDRDGNIRLSQYILNKGGVTTNQVKFRVTDSVHGIVVLPG